MANVTLTNPGTGAVVSLTYQPKMSETVEGKTTLLDFDGRDYAIPYFGDGSKRSLDLDFFVDVTTQGDQWAKLIAMTVGADRGAVLVYSDAFGQTFNVVIDGAVSNEWIVGGTTGQFQHVRFKLTRVE